VKSRKIVLFWDDRSKGQTLAIQYPELHSFAIHTGKIVARVLNGEEFAENFHRPVSTQTHDQPINVNQAIDQISLDEGNDCWHYYWIGNNYSSRQMYKYIMGTSDSHYIIKWLWKSANRVRHKIFFWLALYDRVSTRGLLERKSFHIPSFNCALCNVNREENILR
jgi:hypothetical protein